MTRKQIRYLLFRLKTQTDEGLDTPKLNKGFKKSFESQKKFQGWSSFGVTWDVGGRILNDDNPIHDTTSIEESPWTIVLRDKSLDEAWNDVLRKVVPELPIELLETD